MGKQVRKTFKAIVEAVASDNLHRLFSKALIANRIAKLPRVGGRERAYLVKGAMLWMVKQITGSVMQRDRRFVSADIWTFVVPRHRFRLHIKKCQMAPMGMERTDQTKPDLPKTGK